MSDEGHSNHLWGTVIKMVITAAVTASLTYGFSQSSGVHVLRADMRHVLSQLEDHNRRLEGLEIKGNAIFQAHLVDNSRFNESIQKRVDELRIDFSQRIENITKLFYEVLTTQRELIAYLKAREVKP